MENHTPIADLSEACDTVAIWLEEASQYSGHTAKDLELLKSSEIPHNANILRKAIRKHDHHNNK